MEKVEKANKLKQSKKEMEEKVFGFGKNWTPQITQPNAPKLTTKRGNFSTINNDDEIGKIFNIKIKIIFYRKIIK